MIIIAFCFFNLWNSRNENFPLGLLFGFGLFAENHMELIWQQVGEFVNSQYGFSLAAIDFNGDGIDDLVVGSPKWNNTGASGVNQGKIYFYFGGSDFDNIPDLTIDGSQNNFSSRYGDHIVNLHDVNGDGYEDLGIIRKDHWETNVLAFIDIYYGGPDYDLIVDFTYTIYETNAYYIDSFYSLGDINGDGYIDAGFATTSHSPDFINIFYILYGGQNLNVLYWNTLGKGSPAIRGIGNINNDTYDDFLVSFKDPVTELKHNVIVYGNTIIDTTLTDTLYSQVGTWSFDSGGAYVGDFNGNGTDDFIGCWGYYGIGTYLWFGEDVLTPDPSVYLNCITNGNKCSAWGDLNNDGFSDIVLGDPGWSNNQGKAYFFMGSAYANGSIDMDIPCPAIVGTKFGTSVAVGDFNNDGYDDVAIGAPYNGYPIHEGKVYVYAGNDSLAETTPVSIRSEEIPSVDGIEFNAYPNPFNPVTTISFSIPDDCKVDVSIYNIKGQKVKTLVNEEMEKGLHKIVWDSTDNSGKSVSSGVYFYKLNVNGKDKAVRKCLLLK